MMVQECWQYKVKIQKKLECNSFIPQVNPDNYLIRQIDYHIARKFILEYEWIGNMGTSKYCYGIFFGDNLASVVCYGPPVAPSKYQRLFGNEVSHHILQLCRGASTYWAPRWAPSKLISKSLKIISREFGIQVVVAYADPKAGEIGIIYRACNAKYIGMTSPGGGKKYFINGHEYDPRKVYAKFGSRSHSNLLKIDPNYRTVPITAKHRFVFLIAPRLKRKQLLKCIQNSIQPNPKRE
jgi:hypothetical protein